MVIEEDGREKIAFTMRLKPGAAEAYKARHDAIFPDLVVLLKQAGIADYSIFLDPATGTLFAVMWRRRDHAMATLPANPVMQRWWGHMADLMETQPSHEPVVGPLQPMFHLP